MTPGEKRDLRTGLAFISPWIIGFAVFQLYPLLASIYFSFCDYDVLQRPVWVGLLNYRDMLTDSVFWKALYNTLVFAVFSVPLGIAFSVGLALLLNQDVRGRAAFRTAFFVPSLIPAVAGAMLWMWIFNDASGLLNQFLARFGIEGPAWLGDERWTKPSLILMSIWGTGNAVVVYLASLQDVPRTLYEAADLDGASTWQKVRHVTLPMISPAIYFNLVMGIIGSLQVFSQPFIMLGGGGPNRSALFYAVYLFQNAFDYRQMGYASAMAWFLFAVIGLLTWAATAAVRRRIYYAGE